MHPFQKFYLRVENTIMTRLAPLDSPGPIWRRIFKLPLLLNRLGLPWTLGGRVLILTTTGRKSGLARRTPLEYEYNPETDIYRVMAGWGGKTDWYKNAHAHSRVHVDTGRRKFEAAAVPVPGEEVAQFLHEAIRLNPRAIKMFQRWSDTPIDGSLESLHKAAKHFPSFYLRPINQLNEKG